MSRNIYKIKKYKHFTELQEINYYKPLCCIIISNKLEKNEEFYKNLVSTLNFISFTSPYVCIYLFNKNKIKDSDEFKDIDENKPFFKMIFREIIHESFTMDLETFIPSITEIIKKVNNSIIHIIQQSFNKPRQMQPPIQSPENNNIETIVNKKEHTNIVNNECLNSNTSKKKDNVSYQSEKKKLNSNTSLNVESLNDISIQNNKNKKNNKKEQNEQKEQNESSENHSESLTDESDLSQNDELEQRIKELEKKRKILEKINN